MVVVSGEEPGMEEDPPEDSGLDEDPLGLLEDEPMVTLSLIRLNLELVMPFTFFSSLTDLNGPFEFR